MANSATDSTVSVLAEEEVPEEPTTATVIPMTSTSQPMTAKSQPNTTPQTTQTRATEADLNKLAWAIAKAGAPTPPVAPRSRLPVYEVLAAVLSARVLSLLLVLLDAGVAITTVVAPTNERLIGMSIVFAFSLAAFWLIARLEPARSVARKD